MNRNFKVNDLVIVKTENVARNNWPLARITETYEGKDCVVRSAKIKTPSSELVRPAHLLCLLEAAT